MRYRKLGKTGIDVSVIGLGTWQMGNGSYWNANLDDRESIKTIRTAVDHGVNLIDTAHVYGAGHSEEVVGKAVQEIGRDKVILTTKVGIWYEPDGEYNEATKCLKCDERVVMTQIEQSLKRLRTDYLDFYQIHYAGTTPIEESTAAMQKLVMQGKIRHWGVSNYNYEQLEKVLSLGYVCSYQPQYSLLFRDNQKKIDLCARNNVGVLTYGSIAGGILSGKYRSKEDLPKDGRGGTYPYYQGEAFEKTMELLKTLDEVANAHNCPVSQVAVNWVIQQPGITTALVGMKSPAQAIANASAADWMLTDEELHLINQTHDKLFGTPER